MYTQILVPLDGSAVAARALPVAARLSATFDAPLRVVGWSSTGTLDDLREQVEAQVAAAGVTGAEVAVGTADDDVAAAIAAEVERRPGTLVCMSSTGRSHTGAAFGSVAEAVLHHYVDPVLLVGPGCDVAAFRPDGPMVVCVDGTPTGDAAVPLATSWAIVLHDPVEVVQVVDPDALDAATRGSGVGDVPSETGYTHRIARRIQTDLDRTVDYDVLHDTHAGRAIVEHLTGVGAALAVMGTRGDTGLDRLVVGSVTMEVVHRAPCPVLVTRPPHLPR